MANAVIKDEGLRAALQACRTHLVYTSLFNAVGNVLVLAYPLYMINVFGRVLASQSRETLAALFVGFAIACVFKAIFGWLRSAVFLRAGLRIDRQLSDRVVSALIRRRASGRSDLGNQLLRDLDNFRSFSTGIGGNAAIDLPWAALFLGALAILDPMMGIAAAVSILVIVVLSTAQLLIGRRDIRTADGASVTSYHFIDGILSGSEAIVSMGLRDRILQQWHRVREMALAAGLARGHRDAGFQGALSFTRMIAQGIVLAIGVLQIIAGQTTAGVVFGALIIFNLAMGPFDKLMMAWSSFGTVREGMSRLDAVLSAFPPEAERTDLPKPEGRLEVTNLNYVAPGGERPILKNISFSIRPGVSLGVVGLIGSGKTTLARLLTGCTRPTHGSVRFAGQEMFGWTQGDGGRWVGYLPQNIALLPGTVLDNIGRFGMFDLDEVIEAAKLAGVFDIIQRLPKGFDTVVGPGGLALSGGQQQLIGLARAVVGLPSLVVLDEPNSNLDGPGEDSLMRCIEHLRNQGTTVVFISHRPNLVRQMEQVLILKDGSLMDGGEANAVFERLGRPVVVRSNAAAVAAKETPKSLEKPS